MHKLLVALIIGIVVGILFGASVVAPRLTSGNIESTPQRIVGSETDEDSAILPDENSDGTTAVKQNPDAVDSTSAKDTAAPLNWELASAFPSDMPLFGNLPRQLEKQIDVLSGGVNAIRFHEPGTLAPVAELFEAVRSGAVDAAFTTPIMMADQIPALGLFGSAPFGPTATEMLAWMYAGGGTEALNAIYHERDIHVLPCGMLSAAPAGWFKKKISSVQDMNGLRMRIHGLGARVVEKLGVETISLPTAEILPALERGQIDAAELSLPSVDMALALHSAVDYYYFPGWHQRSTLFVLMMRLEAWQSLNSTHQQYLLTACGDNMRRSLAESEATQFHALKIISSADVKILRFPQTILTALSDAWQVTAREYSKQDEEFDRTWRSLNEFHRDFDIWFDLNRL